MSYEQEIALQRADDFAYWQDLRAHLAECDREVARCRACSDYFGLVPT